MDVIECTNFAHDELFLTPPPPLHPRFAGFPLPPLLHLRVPNP
jgi:hypothetical protein